MSKKLIFYVFLALEAILMASESTTQNINIILPRIILLNVEQPVLNFSTAEAISVSDIPVPLPNVKKAQQMQGSLVVFATEEHILKVQFKPLTGSNLLRWDVNDTLILSSAEFQTTLLWDGSQSAYNFIIRPQGYLGYTRYNYVVTYARTNSLKKSGILEGVITFTMTTNPG